MRRTVRATKQQRHESLQAMIADNPFMTDLELARKLGVSIQTIRLDRLDLAIPELRERMKTMAENSYDAIRSLSPHEVIGEVVELEIGKQGISVFDITHDHVFLRTNIARGHHIFAQANSLAVAVINDEIALTANAQIRFIRQVHLGEQCIAQAKVMHTDEERNKVQVEVKTYVDKKVVFQGMFLIHHADSVE
jgi:acyl-coenzyme A thioesterase PaaI-like protein